MSDFEPYLRRIADATVELQEAVAGIRAALAALPPVGQPGPEPDPEPEPEPEPKPDVYVVQRGDTLSRIAARFPPLTWQSLAAYNQLEPPYTITPGQPLRLTPGPAVPAPDPDDPDAGVALRVIPLPGQVRAELLTERTDVVEWSVARDGSDTTGYGPWSTRVPFAGEPFTFNDLVPGTTYTITVIPYTATGALETLSALATPSGVTPPPTPPPVPSDDTAAGRFGWGPPTWSDEFANGLDPAKWQNSPVGGMDGHDRNGRRIASSAYVQDGILKLHGKSNGDTAWLRQKLPTTYGRWELRFRSRNIGTSGGLYHVLALIWPTSEKWPGDGEYDWLENMAPGQNKIGAFLHYPHPRMPVEQEYREFGNVDTREWNVVAFEWTRNHLKGWVNGRDWYTVSGGAGRNGRRNVQDMPEGYLTLQLDNFTGDGGLREALYEVDWVRFWRV